MRTDLDPYLRLLLDRRLRGLSDQEQKVIQSGLRAVILPTVRAVVGDLKRELSGVEPLVTCDTGVVTNTHVVDVAGNPLLSEAIAVSSVALEWRLPTGIEVTLTYSCQPPMPRNTSVMFERQELAVSGPDGAFRLFGGSPRSPYESFDGAGREIGDIIEELRVFTSSHEPEVLRRFWSSHMDEITEFVASEDPFVEWLREPALRPPVLRPLPWAAVASVPVRATDALAALSRALERTERQMNLNGSPMPGTAIQAGLLGHAAAALGGLDLSRRALHLSDEAERWNDRNIVELSATDQVLRQVARMKPSLESVNAAHVALERASLVRGSHAPQTLSFIWYLAVGTAASGREADSLIYFEDYGRRLTELHQLPHLVIPAMTQQCRILSSLGRLTDAASLADDLIEVLNQHGLEQRDRLDRLTATHDALIGLPPHHHLPAPWTATTVATDMMTVPESVESALVECATALGRAGRTSDAVAIADRALEFAANYRRERPLSGVLATVLDQLVASGASDAASDLVGRFVDRHREDLRDGDSIVLDATESLAVVTRFVRERIDFGESLTGLLIFDRLPPECLSPEDHRLRFELALGLEELGLASRALESYRSVLAEPPGDPASSVDEHRPVAPELEPLVLAQLTDMQMRLDALSSRKELRPDDVHGYVLVRSTLRDQARAIESLLPEIPSRAWSPETELDALSGQACDVVVQALDLYVACVQLARRPDCKIRKQLSAELPALAHAVRDSILLIERLTRFAEQSGVASSAVRRTRLVEELARSFTADQIRPAGDSDPRLGFFLDYAASIDLTRTFARSVWSAHPQRVRSTESLTGANSPLLRAISTYPIETASADAFALTAHRAVDSIAKEAGLTGVAHLPEPPQSDSAWFDQVRTHVDARRFPREVVPSAEIRARLLDLRRDAYDLTFRQLYRDIGVSLLGAEVGGDPEAGQGLEAGREVTAGLLLATRMCGPAALKDSDMRYDDRNALATDVRYVLETAVPKFAQFVAAERAHAPSALESGHSFADAMPEALVELDLAERNVLERVMRSFDARHPLHVDRHDVRLHTQRLAASAGITASDYPTFLNVLDALGGPSEAPNVEVPSEIAERLDGLGSTKEASLDGFLASMRMKVGVHPESAASLVKYVSSFVPSGHTPTVGHLLALTAFDVEALPMTVDRRPVDKLFELLGHRPSSDYLALFSEPDGDGDGPDESRESPPPSPLGGPTGPGTAADLPRAEAPVQMSPADSSTNHPDEPDTSSPGESASLPSFSDAPSEPYANEPSGHVTPELGLELRPPPGPEFGPH